MLELQLSSFFGYGKSEDDSYLGLQAHGVLWAANPSDTPVNWPIAPPIVAGKVSPCPASFCHPIYRKIESSLRCLATCWLPLDADLTCPCIPVY